MHAPYTVSTAETPAIRVLSGRGFAQLLRHATPAGKAVLCGDWKVGRILVERPSLTQVSKATGVGRTHVAAAAKLPAKQRRELDLKAVSLASLTNNRPPTDAQIDRIVAKLGLARVWDALDRLTR